VPIVLLVLLMRVLLLVLPQAVRAAAGELLQEKQMPGAGMQHALEEGSFLRETMTADVLQP
jgi:hypothetical protein